MTASKSHETTANRIAKKFNVAYNKGKGVDVITKRVVIEVEPLETISQGIQQLKGYKKPAYIAVTRKADVISAVARVNGTTIGVMDSHGKIHKQSTRGK